MVARKKTAVVVPEEKKQVVIEKLLAEVQKALLNAQKRITDASFPELDSVVLTLQTAMTLAAEAKVKFVVFTVGMSWEREESQELVLTLKPPKPPQAIVSSLADQLADAIVAVAEGVHRAKTGTPPLGLDSLNVIVAFIVTYRLSAGGNFEIKPVTLELSGSLKKRAQHRIELKFKKQ
jgi:hypothetical protein